MTYPQQYPQYPQYPQQQPYAAPPAAPPPAYAPPPQQGYYPAPQQYAPQAPVQQPLAKGTIDDFYGQPAASGKSISFNNKPVGTTYAGIVARTLTHADIQQQTDINRRPLFHPDGRPKFVMIIPLLLQPSPEFPEGRAAWYVKGGDKTELERAMEEAGLAPGTAPEANAVISITYTGDRPIPNMNPQKVKHITYQRPNGAAPVPAPQPQQTAVPQPVYGNEQQGVVMPPPAPNGYTQVPAPPPVPQPVPAPPAAMAPQAPQPMTQAPQVPQSQMPHPGAYAQQVPQAPAQAAPPMAMPSDLTPEQQERLRQLTGQ